MIRETVVSSGKAGSVLYWTSMPLIIARIALVFLFFLRKFFLVIFFCKEYVKRLSVSQTIKRTVKEHEVFTTFFIFEEKNHV